MVEDESTLKNGFTSSISASEGIKLIEDDIKTLIRESDRLNSLLREERKQAKSDKKEVLLKFIEIIDTFERYFKNIEEKEIDRQTNIWLGYFRSIKKLVERNLKEFAVALIEAPEGKAIPGLHTIIETRKVEGLSDDTILEVIVKGYMWSGEVLRKSNVITVKN